MLKKGLAVIFILLFVGVSFQPVLSIETSNNCSLNELSREHVKHLLWGMIRSGESQIKIILLRIIFEIINDGNATIEEIQEIIDNSVIKEVYLFAEIKTDGRSDGWANAKPGTLRQEMLGFNPKNVYCPYTDDPYFEDVFGWTLYINGSLARKNPGYIFGYSGYLECTFNAVNQNFKLDGFGILILTK
jgi:hypothetical protein